MQTHDAELFRAAAPPAAAVTAGVAAVAAVTVGGRGALGAALGGALVIAFYGLGHAVAALAARMTPIGTMGLALLSYTLKMFALAVLLVVFGDTDAFSRPAFGAAVLAATIVWIAAELRAFTRLRIRYVEPEEPSRAGG